MNSDEVKQRLKNREFQKKIAFWLENTLRPLGDKDLYLSLARQEPFFNPTEKNIKDIFDTLYPFTIQGSPGHDFGHHSRDVLAAAAIIGNDTHLAKALPNDITAAFFGGAYHDLGNGTWPRYQDNVWEGGHAEVGAWLFYTLTENHLPEHIRRLTAYAIAAHTHALSPIQTQVGYVRQPWPDELFYLEDGTPVGIAIWIARFTDRIDTNGISLLCRHIVAQINALDYKGRDLSGKTWYEIGDQSIRLLLKPEIITVENIPTVLMHLKNFADSGRTVTPYSLHDDKFPVMKELMSYKIKQADQILEISQTQTGDPDLAEFKAFLERLSLSPIISTTLEKFDNLWNDLASDEQLKWGPTFKYCQDNYHAGLDLLKSKIDQSTQPLVASLKPLVPDIIKRISLS